MVDRLVNSEANARRIAMVENCFGSSGQPLAEQGRVLVGEGVLTKMCRKKPKARQFFLFNDILVYGNIVINKKKYNKQHVIPLEEVKLESLKDEGQYRNGWLIRTASKSFAVYAATATEKEEWMAHIEKCIEDLLRKSGKQPPSEHAAVWVPDNEAAICMHCKKTQFTVLNRRHHCRKCGAVVCGPCSSKRFVLRTQSEKPLRVCLHCYDRLTRDKARTPRPPAPAAAPAKAAGDAAGSGGESSQDDDSDDEDERPAVEDKHDEPKFYSDGEKTEDTENHSSKDSTDSTK
ncbi:pleckstrin homology domain-containing family F member 2 isoform X1 [Pieris rapae]|uniref:pleckstrin homology domain-containing family F member 2 isoform X1 n=1 Tax=Pieris rapae TaxID=64459 RepID=UPI001E27E7B9|nr:pleckstrin homology domain-containing family F member 2 isoform X1 [Pieris rapae]